MIDLPIAANFARELTEEQFEGPRRARRAGAGADRRPGPNGPEARAAYREQTTARRPEASGRRGVFAATRLGRTLSRLAQVRG